METYRKHSILQYVGHDKDNKTFSISHAETVKKAQIPCYQPFFSTIAFFKTTFTILKEFHQSDLKVVRE